MNQYHMQHEKRTSPSAEDMLLFTPAPVFIGALNHRPAVSSPLSSSPIRATSPLSPANGNRLSQRQTQSSPIPPPKFKFASRPARPNPLMRRREETNTQRRQTYLRSVREKAENKAWQRRDIEGHFLRTNYLTDLGNLSHDAPEWSEADIEDAMAFHQDVQAEAVEDSMIDEGMADSEVEAMLTSRENQTESSTQNPSSPSLSDDEEYDALFAELASREESRQHVSISNLDRMEE